MLTITLWCSSRSRIAVTITASWKSSDHSSKALLDVKRLVADLSLDNSIQSEPIQEDGEYRQVLLATTAENDHLVLV